MSVKRWSISASGQCSSWRPSWGSRCRATSNRGRGSHSVQSSDLHFIFLFGVFGAMFVLVPSHQHGLDKIPPWFVLHPTPPAICTELQRVNDTWWFDTGGCVVSTFISPSWLCWYSRSHPRAPADRNHWTAGATLSSSVKQCLMILVARSDSLKAIHFLHFKKVSYSAFSKNACDCVKPCGLLLSFWVDNTQPSFFCVPIEGSSSGMYFSLRTMIISFIFRPFARAEGVKATGCF